MKRSSGSSSNRTSPSLSQVERTAGDRGGARKPNGRSVSGKPEPPAGDHAPPVSMSPTAENRYTGHPWQACGDPPGNRKHHEHGPPGSYRKRRRPWQARGDPPGAPPRRGIARGDPPLERDSRASSTYGSSSGPIFHPRESLRGRPPPLNGATGPPGARGMNPLSHWPPPDDCGVVRKATFAARQARGDPPGVAALRRVNDPPRSRAGSAPPGRASPGRIGRAPPGRWRNHRRGPPGTRRPHSSLSAGRWRERIPDARTETARHDVARKSTTTKSRKITSWL